MDIVLCFIGVAAFWVVLSAFLGMFDLNDSLNVLSWIVIIAYLLPVAVVFFVLGSVFFILWMILKWLNYLIETNENYTYEVRKTYLINGWFPWSETTKVDASTNGGILLFSLLAIIGGGLWIVEDFWGEDLTAVMDAEEAYQVIYNRILELNPEAKEKTIKKFILG